MIDGIQTTEQQVQNLLKQLATLRHQDWKLEDEERMYVASQLSIEAREKLAEMRDHREIEHKQLYKQSEAVKTVLRDLMQHVRADVKSEYDGDTHVKYQGEQWYWDEDGLLEYAKTNPDVMQFYKKKPKPKITVYGGVQR